MLLVSPYITSSVARTVARIGSGKARVYTLFEAEVFASGASSLRSLRALVGDGHAVHFLPGLHAKVMLFGDSSATVGSQNLTMGGTTRKELTASFQDRPQAQRIRALVEPWFTDAEPITLAMIDAMRAALPKVRKKLKQARDIAKTATDNVINDARKEGEKRRSRENTIRLIRDRLIHHRAPAKIVSARVHAFKDGKTSLLRFSPDDDLTWWQVDGKSITLERVKRYLCILESDGKIGWARVGESRITFIDDSVNDMLRFKGQTYLVNFQANWRMDRDLASNLTIAVATRSERLICRLHCSFEVDRLLIHEIVSQSNEQFKVEREALTSDLEALSDALLPLMLTPFDYEKRLSGARPVKFIGPVGQQVGVALVEFQGHYFLSFKKV